MICNSKEIRVRELKDVTGKRVLWIDKYVQEITEKQCSSMT